MSVDEVLASNLWLWPDPLLKRDRGGRIMFVNAAFLQLYGGQAQDWYGKPLSGWPAPVTNGAQRFETRAGEGVHENVYDWVESVMADGSAMAIARNVTIFMAPQAEPQAPVAQPPVAVETPQQVSVQDANPALAPAQAPQQAAPNLAPEIDEMRAQRAEEYAHEDNRADLIQNQNPEMSEPPESQVMSEVPVKPPVTEVREERRMIERRALPIKDSTAVLGSNWRDEVIAKAVGATGLDGADEQIDAAKHLEMGEAVEGTSVKSAEGLLILLAEDNAINALLTRTLLEADGAEVDTVEDGALALAAVGQKKYDLIFMDMRMPNMDGLESTRKIRATGANMPIIALTANAFDDDRNACFDSGMNDFMTKPVSAEELSEMVENWTKKDEGDKRLAG
ncbi:MAG: response regulator [Robiginitomaculum sp.]|nr:response regulator [Robiginitomaculum sp.]